MAKLEIAKLISKMLLGFFGLVVMGLIGFSIYITPKMLVFYGLMLLPLVLKITCAILNGNLDDFFINHEKREWVNEIE